MMHAAKSFRRLKLNKRFYIILVCFLISTVFWFLLALSHDYPTKLIFPVTYKNIPGKKVVLNELPSKIEVLVKTSGFKILSFGFQKQHDPVEVDVSESVQNNPLLADVISIPTQLFMQDFSRELGNEVSITGFQPDSIVFNFSDLITKKVPVIASVSITFEKQYDSTGSMQVIPAEVNVSGPPSIVGPLQRVYTKNIQLTDVKQTVKMNVPLLMSHLLSYDHDEVELRIPVEKFTEGSTEIQVHPINVTEGYSLKTFPDKIKVRYLVSLSHYNKVDNSMFDAVVDAGDLRTKNFPKLNVKVATSPSFVQITVLEPDKVDYILRKQ